MLKKIFAVLLIIVVILVGVQVVNAEKYEMTLNVIDEEGVVGVNPTEERLDFGDLSRNNRSSRQIVIENGGSMDIWAFAVTWGELSGLARIEENPLAVSPGEERSMTFTVSVPPSAESRVYQGNVWLFRVPKPL